MTHRVGAKGQVVVPKDLRLRTGLQPGAEVDFVLEGHTVVVSARRAQQGLAGRFSGSGMAARLVDDRHQEPR